MKILILAENIGVDEAIDTKIQGIVREFSDDSEIHTYSRQFVMSAVGEYIRAKGIAIHTFEGTLVALIPKEYDAIIAFDAWAMKNSAPFTSEKKIRVTEKADGISLIKEINAKPIAKPAKTSKK